jgi:hypothetical protein
MTEDVLAGAIRCALRAQYHFCDFGTTRATNPAPTAADAPGNFMSTCRDSAWELKNRA